jgi:hypothetical protein
MGYIKALRAAGAEILAFEEFGSYQGDWWAKVRYNDEIGWVHGYYGSCSGCDAYEAEFGWGEDVTEEKLSEFGAQYLGELYSQEEAENKCKEHLEWDLEAQPMFEWVVSQRGTK